MSLALGAIIGFEREMTQKSAGLRTHTLVTFAATLLTILSLSDFFQGLPLHGGEIVDVKKDAARIPAQLVSGIGFIGGGAVLKYGSSVRGLTTAASILTCASIGMLVGIGQYKVAILATLLTFGVLFGLGKVGRRFLYKGTKEFNRLNLKISVDIQHYKVAQLWVENFFKGEILESQMAEQSETKQISFTYTIDMARRKIDTHTISQKLNELPGVLTSYLKVYQEEVVD